MEEEGIVIDAEVPFDRKQLVSMDVAEQVATGTGIHIVNGEVAPIEKSQSISPPTKCSSDSSSTS